MNAYGKPRGSRAFEAVADVSIRFSRSQNTVRLKSLSRDPTSTPDELKADLIKAGDGWFYEPVAAKRSDRSRGEKPRSSTDELLEAALANAGSDGRSYGELAQVPGLSLDKAKKRLRHWCAEGRVARDGGGVKGDPYRWRLVLA